MKPHDEVWGVSWGLGSGFSQLWAGCRGSRAAVAGEFGQRVESKGQAKAGATGRAGTGLTCSPGGF